MLPSGVCQSAQYSISLAIRSGLSGSSAGGKVIWGVLVLGALFRSPYGKDRSILASILGSLFMETPIWGCHALRLLSDSDCMVLM